MTTRAALRKKGEFITHPQFSPCLMDVKSLSSINNTILGGCFSASSRYLITDSLFSLRRPSYIAAPHHTHKLIFSFLILPHPPAIEFLCCFMCCCPSSINCFYVFLMLLRFSSKHTFFYVVLTFSEFKTHSDEIYDNQQQCCGAVAVCIMYDVSSLDVYIFMFKVDTRSCLVLCRLSLSLFHFDVKAA